MKIIETRPREIVLFYEIIVRTYWMTLVVYQSSRRLCVCVSTLSNINISKTSGPIAIKFYMTHHWGRGKAVLCFGLDRIGTLVSMATDRSHRVIKGKCCEHAWPSFLIGSSSYLQVTRTSITSRTSLKFGQIGPRSAE